MIRFLLVAGLLGIGATADAGAKFNYTVTVNATARTASGDLGSARSSADTTQYISCYTFVDPVRTGVCVARDASNRAGVCVTSNAELVDQIRSLNGDSYVSFSWDAGSNCIDVLVYNSSYSQPKVP